MLWLVEIISRHNWIMSRSMFRVLTHKANHNNRRRIILDLTGSHRSHIQCWLSYPRRLRSASCCHQNGSPVLPLGRLWGNPDITMLHTPVSLMSAPNFVHTYSLWPRGFGTKDMDTFFGYYSRNWWLKFRDDEDHCKRRWRLLIVLQGTWWRLQLWIRLVQLTC